jgi:hypothetical protein
VVICSLKNNLILEPTNRIMTQRNCLVSFLLLLIAGPTFGDVLPVLKQKGTETHLIVDGEPFLMLGVETTNKRLDDPADLPHLDENFEMYRGAGVNKVLIPVTWKTFEPVEDQYDYTMIDALIDGCRRHDFKLVVLWFGAIKNGQVGFPPRWFVDDRERFFRARNPQGKVIVHVPGTTTAEREELPEMIRVLAESHDGSLLPPPLQPPMKRTHTLRPLHATERSVLVRLPAHPYPPG